MISSFLFYDRLQLLTDQSHEQDTLGLCIAGYDARYKLPVCLGFGHLFEYLAELTIGPARRHGQSQAQLDFPRTKMVRHAWADPHESVSAAPELSHLRATP